MCVGFGCFKLGVLACVRRVWLLQTWAADQQSDNNLHRKDL